MRKILYILVFIFSALHLHALSMDYRLSGRAGWLMPDGKVDKSIQQDGQTRYVK